ncbi:MAG: hypothetical protein KAY24_11195, partial [Candidatus Eisenbacteria sp.]|nr:hypothetical protein [Candidatus Eisenbacteria bacterium]
RDCIAQLATDLRTIIQETQLSFFEATTALAFEAFAQGGVEVAVIEVGMGGRLDATNVVAPALTVVTGIELDHTKSLGTTREQIAAEKAGIMKPSTPLLMAPSAAGVEEVFRRRGASLRAPVYKLEERALLEAVEPRPQGTWFRFHRPAGRSHHTSGRGGGHPLPRGMIGAACGHRVPAARERNIRLLGAHQARNALLAEEAARLLASVGLTITERARVGGLVRARWPGRFQVLPSSVGRPVCILDVAHNPSGCETVVTTYRHWMNGDVAPTLPTLIVGMLGDKDHRSFFRILRGISDRVYLIPLRSTRAGPVEDLAQSAHLGGFEPKSFTSMRGALTAALQLGAPVLITGSFLTVEAAMDQLGLDAESDLFAPEDVISVGCSGG